MTGPLRSLLLSTLLACSTETELVFLSLPEVPGSRSVLLVEEGNLPRILAYPAGEPLRLPEGPVELELHLSFYTLDLPALGLEPGPVDTSERADCKLRETARVFSLASNRGAAVWEERADLPDAVLRVVAPKERCRPCGPFTTLTIETGAETVDAHWVGAAWLESGNALVTEYDTIGLARVSPDRLERLEGCPGTHDAVLSLGDDRFWLGTDRSVLLVSIDEGLNRCEPQGGTPDLPRSPSLPPELPTASVVQLALGPEPGQLYAMTGGGELAFFDGGDWTHLGVVPAYQRDLAQNGKTLRGGLGVVDGVLFANAGEYALLRVDGDGVAELDLHEQILSRGTRIERIGVVPGFGLLVGTDQSEVLRFDGGRWTSLETGSTFLGTFDFGPFRDSAFVALIGRSLREFDSRRGWCPPLDLPAAIPTGMLSRHEAIIAPSLGGGIRWVVLDASEVSR